MTHRLLVTGDDFGLDAGANAAIIEAHQAGVLTNASLMVTGEAAEAAAALARSEPRLSVGLHLVLCDGLAASPPREIPDLVDAAGRFEKSPFRAGIRYWARRRSLRGQLQRELRAQIDRFLAMGLELDHVDGHHHLHMHPVVFETLFDCLRERRAPRWVRLVREDRAGRVSRFSLTGEVVPAIFSALAARHRDRLASIGIESPDRVYGLRQSGAMGVDTVLGIVSRARAERVEIYAHPNRSTEGGLREERALVDPRIRQAIVAAGYELVNARGMLYDSGHARCLDRR